MMFQTLVLPLSCTTSNKIFYFDFWKCQTKLIDFRIDWQFQAFYCQGYVIIILYSLYNLWEYMYIYKQYAFINTNRIGWKLEIPSLSSSSWVASLYPSFIPWKTKINTWYIFIILQFPMMFVIILWGRDDDPDVNGWYIKHL